MRNILFILTDQLRHDSISAFGNTKIQTPNLDRLAQSATVFERAYVTQPLCTPSRASILSGLYPHKHGCTTNAQHAPPQTLLNPGITTLADHMKASGYTTAHIGKWHLGNERTPQHGFDTWISTEDKWQDAVSLEAYKNLHSDYHRFLIQAGFVPDRETAGFSSFSTRFCTRVPEPFCKPSFIAQEATRFIREHRDKPFLLYLDFLEPHPPYGGPMDDLYSPQDIDLPPAFGQPLPSGSSLSDTLNRSHHAEKGYFGFMKGLPLNSELAWRTLIARYWGLVTLVDKYIGRVLQCLTECRLDKDTTVVFTSDHGDMMGDFGMLQKSTLYEPSVHVPLMLKIPGVTQPDLRLRSPVSLADLMPTLLDAHGLGQPDHLDGCSLMPAVTNPKAERKQDVLIQWNNHPKPAIDYWSRLQLNETERESRMAELTESARSLVTTEGWKFTWGKTGRRQLFDLNNDPHETKNLVDFRECPGLVNDLEGRMLKQCLKIGDDWPFQDSSE